MTTSVTIIAMTMYFHLHEETHFRESTLKKQGWRSHRSKESFAERTRLWYSWLRLKIRKTNDAKDCLMASGSGLLRTNRGDNIKDRITFLFAPSRECHWYPPSPSPSTLRRRRNSEWDDPWALPACVPWKRGAARSSSWISVREDMFQVLRFQERWVTEWQWRPSKRWTGSDLRIVCTISKSTARVLFDTIGRIGGGRTILADGWRDGLFLDGLHLLLGFLLHLLGSGSPP